MARRGPTQEECMDALVEQMETLSFPKGQNERVGFKRIGVKKPQRIGGHVSCLEDLCVWTWESLPRLNLDPLIVWKICRNHDRKKAIVPDQSRIKGDTSQGPIRFIRRLVRKMQLIGFSKEEREAEYVESVELIYPYLRPETPAVGDEVEISLDRFFLQRGKRVEGGREAQYVHDMGEVMDVHVVLWYIRAGQTQATDEDIRSFVTDLTSRISDRTAKLYWSRVKVRYLDILKQVYGRPSVALAQ